jgi:hypothetical protein
MASVTVREATVESDDLEHDHASSVDLNQDRPRGTEIVPENVRDS